MDIINEWTILNGSVAQLDRAFDYESKGRRFESCRGHHLVTYSPGANLVNFVSNTNC
ncbi:MAG: hypothetical protein H6Q73_404 [Firmicutes bacterium]|nr:hypothetical protein [Bacillota bacterium]